MTQTGMGKRILFSCFFGAMVMILGLSSSALAGDHLSSTIGCTECHGTNVRSIHDYEETIKADCNICHFAGGTLWPVNDAVNEMFVDFYGDFNPLIPCAGGGYVLPEGFEFDFACKSCHVGQNSGHQSK